MELHLCRVIWTAGAVLCYPRESHSTWNTTQSSNSSFPYPHFLHKNLPSPPPQGSSRRQQPTHPFSLLRYAAQPMSNQRLFPLSLTPRNSKLFPSAPSKPGRKAPRPVSRHGRRHLAAEPAILCAAQGKGSQLNEGTGFDAPAANWAMLLQHIPAMSSVRWYTGSTDVVWWLALASQHSWSVQHAHHTFSLFIWLKNYEYTAFLLCRDLGQFSLLAEEQRLWYNFHTVLQACKDICYSACVDCLSACKCVCTSCCCALKICFHTVGRKSGY